MNNGYFDDNKREYVITDMKPRRLWYNYLWNEEMICVCDQFGMGNSFGTFEGQRKTLEAGERNVYIKDKTEGVTYSANRNYNDLPFEEFETHVGMGYHTVIGTYMGVKTTFTTLLPTTGSVTLFKVTVKNCSGREKDLSVYTCLFPQPALTGHDAYGYGDYYEEYGGCIYSHEGFHVGSKYTKIYVGCDKKCDGYEITNKYFKGEYNGYHNPVGLQKDRLTSKGYDFESNYISAFQFDERLKDGEGRTYYFCVTAAKSFEECADFKQKYLAKGYFEKVLEEQKAYNEEYLNVFTMNTPDEYMNSQANIWLKRQVSLGKTWGRVYGKGFRDVMQDITAFVSYDPELAKKRILLALAHQYEDGNPIRMFEPNFRYPYNDGGVWIPGAVLAYINETGDLSILDEQVTYLKGDSYENASLADSFTNDPYVAGERVDSVLEHVVAAIDYLLNCRGERNLVLWRGGDWNDSLNNAGNLNKGESVWLSIATYKAVNELQEILKLKGCEEKIADLDRKKEELKQAVMQHGFKDGKFIYGINDYGEDVGGEERTFLNPQTWAVLADIGEKDLLEKVMDRVENTLKCKYGYVQCYPCFEKGDDKIGRVSYFRKGLVENGAVYNHGVAFKIVADCKLGRGNNAYNSFKLISCDNPDNANSGVEPYAVSNMYIGPENKYSAGFAPMSWITGTAGWLYRCVSEYICGIKPTYDGLKIQPCMPDSWNGVTAERKFRGETYKITYKRTGKNRLLCDGKQADILPLSGAGSVHEVICEF